MACTIKISTPEYQREYKTNAPLKAVIDFLTDITTNHKSIGLQCTNGTTVIIGEDLIKRGFIEIHPCV